MNPNGNPGGTQVLNLAPGQWVLQQQPTPWPETCAQLGEEASAFLKGLNLLELNDQDFHWWEDTPFDKQAMTSGATWVSKITAPEVGTAGVGGAVATFVKGWSTSSTAQWVLLGCAVFLLAVTALSVALIVRADLNARATSTAAQYRARAQAAAAFVGIFRPSVPRSGSGAMG